MLHERREKLIRLARSWPKRRGPEDVVAKRRVGIEDLLRWAYREELPKEGAKVGITPDGFGGAWGGVEKYGAYLTVIDEGGLNRFGVVPEEFTERGPHPDAVAIAGAVAALDGWNLNIPDGWDPFEDLGELGGLRPRVLADVMARLTACGADGERALKTPPLRLVFRHAIMGGCPVWQADVPEVRTICGANGRAVWFAMQTMCDPISGTAFEVERTVLASGRRQMSGAYRKYYLDPDPVDAGVARGEYEIWRAALDVLVLELEDNLESVEVLPSARAYRPWMDGEREPCVLRDVSGDGRLCTGV